jgi:hypothetical protein
MLGTCIWPHGMCDNHAAAMPCLISFKTGCMPCTAPCILPYAHAIRCIGPHAMCHTHAAPWHTMPHSRQAACHVRLRAYYHTSMPFDASGHTPCVTIMRLPCHTMPHSRQAACHIPHSRQAACHFLPHSTWYCDYHACIQTVLPLICDDSFAAANHKLAFQKTDLGQIHLALLPDLQPWLGFLHREMQGPLHRYFFTTIHTLYYDSVINIKCKFCR